MITVLITGISVHSHDLINELRRNYDNEEIRIVGINAYEPALLREGVDAGYVVPYINDTVNLPTLLRICLDEHVDVIMPFITAELPILAENRNMFEQNGIMVSVTSPESLALLNNKIALGERYGELMPRQCTVKSISDIFEFAGEIGYPEKSMCCKLPNRCGGIGFMVVDESKGKDISIVNRFGECRYITFNALLDYYANCEDEMILQEYESGRDYSMCILADNGELIHGLGFEASLMSFGSAMFASIKFNRMAFDIAKRITEDTGLDGNACFDFIMKPDDSVKLLEVNPRLSATLPFIARAGLNLPYLRCRQLLGYDVKNVALNINYNLRMRKNYESEYFV